ncbi:MAG: T9SS type B sorting domain-containing protein, partial [Paludibacteraceae bacterium]|nr:T9SS type B sorting domain-containing protein [Paludibacteraceae bacterium]
AEATESKTYYVKQTDGKCEGEKTAVTVVISSSPRPVTRNLNLCEGEDLAGRTLLDLVDIDPNGGDASAFSLRWYADASKAGSGEGFTETPEALSSVKETAEATESKTYYVTQVNAEGAESGVSEIVVTVYARPVLAAVAKEPVCGGSVDLKTAWQVENGVAVEQTEYTLDGSAFAQGAATANGNYAVRGWFNVPTPGNQSECSSEPVALDFRIDMLSEVVVKGSATACPNSEVPLSVEYETNVEGGIAVEWTGDVADAASASTKTAPLAGVSGDVHRFKAKVTAGACVLESDEFAIELGKGVLSGNILATENGNDSIGVSPYPAEGGSVKIYSCGSEVSLTADLQSTSDSFEWVEVGGTASYPGKTAAFAPQKETTYRLTFINECEATLDVTVVPVPVAITAAKTASEVCEGEEVEFRMEVDCVENPTLAWLRNGEKVSDGSSLKVTEAKVSDAGVYAFEARNRGCFVSGEVGELKVKPYAKVVEPAEPFVVAKGGSLSITLDLSGNGSTAPDVAWTERGQKVFDGAEVSMADVTESHTYAVQLTGADYCQTDITVEVWVDASAVVALSGDKDKICLGESVLLKADTAGTGRILDPSQYSILWEAKSGAAFAALAEQGKQTEMTVSPTMDVEYRVTVYYKDQVVSSEAYAVAVYSPATFTEPAEQTICAGDRATLTVSDILFTDAVVVWEEDASITTALEGATVEVEPEMTTTYRFTVSREIGCPVEGTAVVNVTRKPELEVTSDTTICSGDKVTLSARVTGGTSGKLQWTDLTTGETLAETGTLTVMPETDASYRVTVDGGVCGLTQEEVNVTVGQVPTIDSVEVVSRKTVEVTANGGDGNYLYKVGLTGEYSPENRMEVTRYSTYDFYVVDGNGCETKRTFTVKAPEIFFPTEFTPNGDGIQDQWDVTNLAEAYPDAVVIIYDRYGKKLSEMKASEGSWDGTYNGKKMPATDYWYEVNIDEADKFYVGHFTLMR